MANHAVVVAALPTANWVVKLVNPVWKMICALREPAQCPPSSRIRTHCSISRRSSARRSSANVLLILVIARIFPAFGLCQQPANTQATSPYLQSKPVKRLALVIGNPDYENLDKLDQVPTAGADMIEVVNLLKSAGFTTVRSLKDVSSKGEILSFARELANQAGSSDEPVIFFIYFAGHGFQSGAWPFLVPASVDPNNLYDQSLGLNELIDLFSSHQAGLAVFVIDACRNIVSATSHKTISAYDAAMSKIKLSAMPAAEVTVIDLSTEYDTAANNVSPMSKDNSPYEWEFMQQARITQSLGSVFQKMESRMSQDLLGTQVPVLIDQVNIQHFFLLPDTDEDTLEAKEWQDTLGTNRKRCVGLYAKDFPASPYLMSAQAWLHDNQVGGDTYELCPVDQVR
jgi:hypothetical protein